MYDTILTAHQRNFFSLLKTEAPLICPIATYFPLSSLTYLLKETDLRVAEMELRLSLVEGQWLTLWLEAGLLFELPELSKERHNQILLFQELKIVVVFTTTVRFSRRKTRLKVLN